MRKTAFVGFVAGISLAALSPSSSASALDLSNVNSTPASAEPAVMLVDAMKAPEPQEPAGPPVSQHTVGDGESLEKIAAQHNTTWKRLFDKNTSISDPDVITVGMTLTIPTADEVLAERPLPEPPAPEPEPTRSRATQPAKKRVMRSGAVAGNSYTPGMCTWYVKNRRPDLPNNLGNAYEWLANARAQGMATGSAPRAGAVGHRNNHVVYVESVNGDGTVTISEMNYNYEPYSQRTITRPADYFTYIY